MTDAAPNDNASLASLTATTGVLVPPFEPEVTEYHLDVELSDAEVAFTPTAAVPAGTTITVNGDEVTSGNASPILALAPGSRDVDVVVVAESGAEMTYRVHVHRGSDTLASIALYAGDALTTTLVPTFDAATSTYTLEVALWLQTLQISVAPVDADATITISGSLATAGVPTAPIALGLGLTSIAIVVTAPGGDQRTYTLNVSRASAILQQAYGKASNAEAGDRFGTSVALWGNTLAVGASSERSAATGVDGSQADNGASSSGAVYVFTRTGTTWSQQAYLKASNTGFGDSFGNAVALWGDTLAVGAFQERSNATGFNGNQADNSALASGAVYVFTRTDGTWSQQAYLKASNTGEFDYFGNAVALWGDTLAVGAYGEDSPASSGNQNDNSALESGAVYVFTRTGVTWSQQAYLKGSNTGANDIFGLSVALWDDTLAVGAAGEASAATGVGGNQADNSAGNSGAVYVFTRTGTTWSQQAYVKASNTGYGDRFGTSVALWGDTLAVGAYMESSIATGVDGNQANNSALASGAVYVFTRSGGTWAQQAYLKASNTAIGDYFGYSVALWDDTLAVGAPGESSAATGVDGNQADNSASSSGAVFLFVRNDTTWSQQAYIKASNPAASDSFGTVALWASTLAVGAAAEDSAAIGVAGDQTDNSADDSGAVYVFH